MYITILNKHLSRCSRCDHGNINSIIVIAGKICESNMALLTAASERKREKTTRFISIFLHTLKSVDMEEKRNQKYKEFLKRPR